MKTKRLVFDIETTVNEQAIAVMPDPQPAANLKDPEKIEANIREKRQEMVDKAPLDPDLGRILSIGYCLYNSESDYEVTADVAKSVDEERVLIQKFWVNLLSCGGACVGYNILSFDLPFILRRSMALEINPPIIPFMAKFRAEPVTDLMGILYNWGPAKGLKTVAKLYGLPVLTPGIDGSMVEELTDEQVALYCKSDVLVTLSLFNKMNGVYFNL